MVKVYKQNEFVMDLEKCYCVENLYPTVTNYDNMYYVQYDIYNNHIRFGITEKNICNKLYIAQIKQRVVEWIGECME